jgi:hypothetical protein
MRTGRFACCELLTRRTEIQATGMAVITIPIFLLGLHVFVSCIQRVESARHDHEGQVPKQQRHFRLLSVSAEQRHHRVGDIFPSLQILRDPSIPLRNCSVRVRNIGLAGPGQLRVFLCLFPIALCSLRPTFHFNPPLFAPVNASSGMGHRDEGDGARTGLNWARRAATGCAGRASANGAATRFSHRPCIRAQGRAIPQAVSSGAIFDFQPMRVRLELQAGTGLAKPAIVTIFKDVHPLHLSKLQGGA